VKYLFLLLSLCLILFSPQTLLAEGSSEGVLLDPEKMYQQILELKKEVDSLKKESDVRKKLTMTSDESDNEKKKILDAAGREYTLLKSKTFGLEYSFRYSYNTLDKLVKVNENYTSDWSQDHIIENDLFFEYAIKDNITLNLNMPFMYKYKNLDTEDEQTFTNIGDVSIGCQWQPFKSGGSIPTTILNATLVTPTGRSPYEVSVGEELYSGSGFYSLILGSSFSKAVDPVYIFSSISATYSLPVDGLSQKWGAKNNYTVLKEVTPGPSIGLSSGFAYSLSYKMSLSFGYQLLYKKGNDYKFDNGAETSSESYMASSINIGTSWRLNPKRSLNFNLQIGLTDNDSDFTISFRLPMQFAL